MKLGIEVLRFFENLCRFLKITTFQGLDNQTARYYEENLCNLVYV